MLVGISELEKINTTRNFRGIIRRCIFSRLSGLYLRKRNWDYPGRNFSSNLKAIISVVSTKVNVEKKQKKKNSFSFESGPAQMFWHKRFQIVIKNIFRESLFTAMLQRKINSTSFKIYCLSESQVYHQ